MRKSVFSDYDKMKDAIDNTDSIKEAMLHLGRIPSGGNYKHFRDWAKTHGIEIKRGSRSVVGNPRMRKHTNEDMFSVDSTCNRNMVRGRIITDGLIPYVCSVCGNNGSHNNLPLSLHLDHINGIGTDHRLENLRFLCPNCHSQTETYGGKNNSARKPKPPLRKDYPERRKVTWPTKQELASLLDYMSYVQVGKMFGVSDNAVRKWAKKYGIL